MFSFSFKKSTKEKLFKSQLDALHSDVDKAFQVSAKIIESGAKVLAGRQEIKDTGALLSSIKATKNDQMEFVIGSPLKYAERNEKGGRLSQQELDDLQRLAANRKQSRHEKNKGVLDMRRRYWRPRPYLIPAFENEMPKLAKEIRKLTKTK
jgi:hypothetical protein